MHREVVGAMKDSGNTCGILPESILEFDFVAPYLGVFENEQEPPLNIKKKEIILTSPKKMFQPTTVVHMQMTYNY